MPALSRLPGEGTHRRAFFSFEPMTKNGYVTWRVFIGAMITLTGLIFGSGAWALSGHSDHVHDGAVTQREFERVLRELKEIKLEIRLLRQQMAKP